MNNGLSSITGTRVFPASADTARTAVISGEKTGEQAPPNDLVTISPGKTPETTAAPEKVKVKIFPQDPLMGEPVIAEMDKADMGKDLKGPRVAIEERTIPIAIPDIEGNYLFEPLTPQFDQVNAYVITAQTLDMAEKYVGHKVTWAFGEDQISVIPHAKEGANAYYARWEGALNLMFFKSDKLNKIIQTSQSADVISHELGHAVLDGLRPNFISSWNTETRAYHEAFADCMSMLFTLSNDANVEAVIKETGGDLSKNNRISMLAEEFGKAVRLKDNDPSNDDQTWLRNSINNFKYVPPSELPKEGPRDTLTSEPHSFARIFTGAFYDIIQHTFQSHLQRRDDGNMVEALKSTRDHLGALLLKSVDLSASSGATFHSMALSMLKADDMLNGGVNKSDLVDVFVKRNILTDSDVELYEHSRDEMPEVKLEKPIESEAEAMQFLKKNEEELGVFAKDYSKAQINRDEYGNTIIQYSATKEVALKEHGIEKAADLTQNLSTDVNGGVTLCFDKSGTLISLVSDAITTGKVTEAVDEIKAAIDEEKVRRQPLYKTDNMFHKGKPYEAEVYQEPSGKFKIQRLPVMVI